MKRPAPRTLQIGFIIGGLLFSVLFLAFTLDIDRDGLIPDETRLAELRSEEKKQSAELKELLNRDAAFRETENAYRKLFDDAWSESVHGSPDVEIPKLISAAARRAGLELNGTGAVKRTRLNNELLFLEIDVNAASELTMLAAFWNELRSTPVPAGWKRIDLRPELSQSTSRIMFNGTLRFLGREETESSAGGNGS